MSKKSRRRFTAEEKAAILRKLMFEKVPMSDLADQTGVQPSVIYGWQRQAQENLERALEKGNGAKRSTSRERELEAKIQALEARLAKRDNVIAEISEEFVALKKELGEH